MDELEEKRNFNKETWIRLYSYLKNYKKEAIIAITTLFLMSIADSFFPIITKLVIDNFVVYKTFEGIQIYIFWFFILTLIKSLTMYFFIYENGKIESGLIYTIRKQIFDKIQDLSLSYFNDNSVGKVLNTASADVNKLGHIIAWNCIDVVWSVSILLIITINMLIIDFRLAMIVIIFMPIIVFILKFFQKRVLKTQREVRQVNSEITGKINEGIGGALASKSLNIENKNQEEFELTSEFMRKISVKSSIIISLFVPIVILIGSISIGIVVQVGATEVLNEEISYGTFNLFITYAIMVFEPIRVLSNISASIQTAQVSAERIFDLIDTEPTIYDTEEVISIYGDHRNPKIEKWEIIQGNIKFKNVSFFYNKNEKILNDFNLEIKAGEKIALIGKTGAGKSTIVNLLSRFYEPSSGSIMIDDIDYKERPMIWLQSNLGYILQTPYFFSGTVAENIKYANPDASYDELINSIKLSNCYDFIMNKKEGLDFYINENGSNLSSGQRQLISLARVIIGNKKIIILDEATSNIDTQTEYAIQNAINKTLQGKTSIIIAHRLSTIKLCDRILVIDNGEILEMGNHEQLLKLKGKYYQLYTNQFKISL